MINKMPDIYFLPQYGELYEEIEKGKVETFKYESDLGLITNMFIKRRIPIDIGEEIYYDITTPYGYGGPVILECIDGGSRQELVKGYNEAFGIYCRENNIVSEFIRFHPLVKNYEDFKDVYDIQYMRKTLGTNLKDFDDPFQSEFSKSGRKNIRRSLRKGVTFKVEEDVENIDEFINIYNTTMDRKDADEYYYFGEKYFNDIIQNFKGNILLVKALYNEEIIASGLYFIFDKIIHIHLSGTLDEYLELSPAYILRYAVTLWGKENGYELIHHGGGISNSAEDSLLRFKKRFAKNTEFDFYIGEKIWNKKIYEELTDKVVQKEIDYKSDFFPIYRI